MRRCICDGVAQPSGLIESMVCSSVLQGGSWRWYKIWEHPDVGSNLLAPAAASCFFLHLNYLPRHNCPNLEQTPIPSAFNLYFTTHHGISRHEFFEIFLNYFSKIPARASKDSFSTRPLTRPPIFIHPVTLNVILSNYTPVFWFFVTGKLFHETFLMKNVFTLFLCVYWINRDMYNSFWKNKVQE